MLRGVVWCRSETSSPKQCYASFRDKLAAVLWAAGPFLITDKVPRSLERPSCLHISMLFLIEGRKQKETGGRAGGTERGGGC